MPAQRVQLPVRPAPGEHDHRGPAPGPDRPAGAWFDPPAPIVCVRRGREWLLQAQGRRAAVGHSVGMLHLAVLLANPGTELPAEDLAAGAAAFGGGRAAAGWTSAQPVLDRTAVRRYLRRLDELRGGIEDLETAGDERGSAALRAERDQIMAEIGAATGLGGRGRTFAGNGERARVAVGKAIRRAIARVEEVDGRIGAHLRRSVHTGIRCWYRP